MKLTIGNLHVQDVCLGSENSFKDGILTIDKAVAIEYLKGEDDHITDLDIVIARPGDDTRIVPVIVLPSGSARSPRTWRIPPCPRSRMTSTPSSTSPSSRI